MCTFIHHPTCKITYLPANNRPNEHFSRAEHNHVPVLFSSRWQIAAAGKFALFLEKMVRFKEDEIFKFLDLYKRHECLWKSNHKHYKIKSKRNEAYSRIREAMNLSSNLEVKLKVKSFRDTYASERIKVKRSNKLAVHPGEVYRPRLRWYNLADSFLNNSCLWKENMVVGNITDPIPAINPNGPVQQNGSDKTVLPEQSIDMTNEGTENSNFSFVNGRTLQNERNSSQAKIRDGPLQPTHQTDEFYYFGMNLAMQLRTLPLAVALNLQTKFQQMLCEQRVQCGQSHFDIHGERSASSVYILEENSETNEEDVKPEFGLEEMTDSILPGLIKNK